MGDTIAQKIKIELKMHSKSAKCSEILHQDFREMFTYAFHCVKRSKTPILSPFVGEKIFEKIAIHCHSLNLRLAKKCVRNEHFETLF